MLTKDQLKDKKMIDKKHRKIKFIIKTILLLLLVMLIFFNIPYSKTRQEFSELIRNQIELNVAERNNFTIQDLNGLPGPVQKYFIHCGYIGTPKRSYMKAFKNDVSFVLERKKPPRKMD